jgi:hypothetical protein
MEFQNYLLEPVKERIEIINQQVNSETPFWQERLNTAIKNNAPLVVSFNQQLVKEYWEIKNKIIN